MDGDVSRRTISVLVALTIVISVLGALSVVSVVAELKHTEVSGKASQQGWVGLEITQSEQTEEMAMTGATGNVALEIQA